MSLEVGEDLVVQQVQPVADAQVVLAQSPRRSCAAEGVAGDGELGAADFLATKQVAHRLDGGVLVVQVGFKMSFIPGYLP